MLTLPVLDKEGKEIEQLELPEKIFGGHVNTDIIHQAVVMYQACLRQGTASTKERGSVSGGGKKPWRQKGTGRARAGSSRSPLWRKGGIVFGPHPRDFSYSIPKKMKKAALRESLNAKFQSKTMLCVVDLRDKFSKTKEFAALLNIFALRGKTLAVLDGSDESVRLVSRNIARLEVVRTDDINAYDIMRNKNLLLTKTAFRNLLKRVND